MTPWTAPLQKKLLSETNMSHLEMTPCLHYREGEGLGAWVIKQLPGAQEGLVTLMWNVKSIREQNSV